MHLKGGAFFLKFLKVKKIFPFTLLLIFFISFFFGMDYTLCYALSYDDEYVGTTASLNNIKTVDKGVNDKVKNADVKIEEKINYSYIFTPLSSVNSNKEIEQNIIQTTSKIEEQYGLVVNDEVCYIAKNEKNIEDKIEKIKNKYKKDHKLKKCYTEDYEIQKGFYLNKEYNEEKIVETLKINTNKRKQEKKIRKIKRKTIRKKDWLRVGSKRVEQKGRDGTVIEKYDNAYFDKELKSSVLKKKKVKRKRKAKIISIPFKRDKNADEVQGITSKQEQFLNKIVPEAIKIYKKENILPSLTVAQAVVESGWGEYHIGNNIYGIKAYGDWDGKKSRVWTSEQTSKGSQRLKSWFKNYDSIEDSVRDYGKLLSTSLYTRVREAENYREAAEAVKACGYATSSTYAEKLIDVIERHHLYIWDKEGKKAEVEEEKEEEIEEEKKAETKEREKNSKKEKKVKEKKEKKVKKSKKK